jgi:hypothetical protein
LVGSSIGSDSKWFAPLAALIYARCGRANESRAVPPDGDCARYIQREEPHPGNAVQMNIGAHIDLMEVARPQPWRKKPGTQTGNRQGIDGIARTPLAIQAPGLDCQVLDTSTSSWPVQTDATPSADARRKVARPEPCYLRVLHHRNDFAGRSLSRCSLGRGRTLGRRDI